MHHLRGYAIPAGSLDDFLKMTKVKFGMRVRAWDSLPTPNFFTVVTIKMWTYSTQNR